MLVTETRILIYLNYIGLYNMAKHSNHNVRLDDFTKNVLVKASEEMAMKQAELVRELIFSKFPEIVKQVRLRG